MMIFKRAACLAGAGLLAAGIATTAYAQLAAPIQSPVPQGIDAQDSAGFAKGKYAALDALPDWGGIWFLVRSAGPQTQPVLKDDYAAERERWRAEVLANGGVERRNRSNCSPPGLPRIMRLAQYPYEFLFTPGRVTINQEAWMQTRTIWTDGREHPPIEEIDPTFHGHSIGHWEGDTLVVDTIGISDELEFGEGGVHSDQFRLVERIHLSPDDPDVLVNEMTMTDPLALAEPYKVEARYRRDRHGSLIEFQCSENDRNPVNEHGETLFE
ncbi:hypothetical protein WYH_03307 (plasmid) [Croceibacterium atlanticum]|uniref:Uncharacterized protein n=1 Tax=Croceibacterium atlanticum TaxID=1267766 RepID=A0A0F7KYK0_9SPHN|nr:hypothetical protein [Croceibacterium atlanticum]AKH44326.1 hypothetical protein WYH_03307 [Croceibacterium atlanticum]